MNKKYRHELKMLKYKKRLKFWASIWTRHRTKDGDEIISPTYRDLINDNTYSHLRTQAVMCSCWMCSKDHKYKRKDFKFESYKIIKEALNDIFDPCREERV